MGTITPIIMSLVCGSRPEVALPAVGVELGEDVVVAAAVANVEPGVELVEALDVELEDEEAVELGSNTVARLCTMDKNPGRFSEDCANALPMAMRITVNRVASL